MPHSMYTDYNSAVEMLHFFIRQHMRTTDVRSAPGIELNLQACTLTLSIDVLSPLAS